MITDRQSLLFLFCCDIKYVISSKKKCRVLPAALTEVLNNSLDLRKTKDELREDAKFQVSIEQMVCGVPTPHSHYGH